MVPRRRYSFDSQRDLDGEQLVAEIHFDECLNDCEPHLQNFGEKNFDLAGVLPYFKGNGTRSVHSQQDDGELAQGIDNAAELLAAQNDDLLCGVNEAFFNVEEDSNDSVSAKSDYCGIEDISAFPVITEFENSQLCAPAQSGPLPEIPLVDMVP